MKEKEIRGFIEENEFSNKLKYFSENWGEPSVQERIALVIGDFDKYDVEIRIRTTNGETEMTYKVGDQDAVKREEITTRLPKDADVILNLYKSFEHISSRAFKKPYYLGIRHKNYLFYRGNYELKLFEQFNDKNKFYAFELEEIEKSTKDIFDYARGIGLTPRENFNSRELVEERNEKYNIFLKEFDYDYIKNLIIKYLEYGTQTK